MEDLLHVVDQRREIHLLDAGSALARISEHLVAQGRRLFRGHLDGGDSWLSAVKREVKEETGLKIFDPQLLGLYSDPELTLSQYLIKDKYFAHYIVMAFLVTRYEGTLRLNDEVVEFQWASPDHLPQPIFRANEVQIQDAVCFDGKVIVR